MALTIDTTWEVRTSGSPTNGGGFVATVDGVPTGGTDFSRQDQPALQLSDAQVDGVTLTTVSGGFTPSLVGNLLQINTGPLTFTGHYRIVSIDGPTQLTLDRPAGSAANLAVTIGGALGGNPGSNDSLQRIFTAAEPGHRVNVRAGHYVLETALNPRTNGTRQHPILVSGYLLTPGDADEPVVTLDAAGADIDLLVAAGDFWSWQYLRLTGNANRAHGGAIVTGRGNLFDRCRIDQVGAFGLLLTGEGSSAIGCEVDHFGQAVPQPGVTLSGNTCTLLGTHVHDGNGSGVNINGGFTGHCAHTLVTGNTAFGFEINRARPTALAVLSQCIAYANGAGGVHFRRPADNRAALLHNSIIAANGGHGLSTAADGRGAVILLGTTVVGNALGPVDARTTVTESGPATPLPAQPFVNPDASDYRLAAGITGDGWPARLMVGGRFTGPPGFLEPGVTTRPRRPLLNPLLTGDDA